MGRGGRVRGSSWGGGQAGCERRIEVFVKIQTKKMGGGGCVGGGVGLGIGLGGGQAGCERRIEVFVKIQKRKILGGGGGWAFGGGCPVGGRGSVWM